MRRIIPAILLIAVLAIGGGIIASTAYQAGLQTAVTTTAAGTGTTVVVPAYGVGYGWHPFGFGFGIFGFFATLFFLFVVFALIRAIVWRGGPGRRGGWGGPGSYGWGYGPGAGTDTDGDRAGRSPWESRAHDTFDTWHRQAHDAPAASRVDAPAPPTPPADPV